MVVEFPPVAGHSHSERVLSPTMDCALGRSPVGRETTEKKVLG